MHYKGFLITKEVPNHTTIEDILRDYYYDNEDNKSGFTWDWYLIGGRYCDGLQKEKEHADSAFYEELVDFDITDCYLVVSDNYFNVREKWDGNHFIENLNFDKEVKEINLKNKYITIIDFHD